MKITINIPEKHAKTIQEAAKATGLEIKDLALAAIVTKCWEFKCRNSVSFGSPRP